MIEPQYVAMMNAMMQETLLTGTARKAELPGWQAAGKTGTSQDFRDAWFVGYTAIWSPASGSATTTTADQESLGRQPAGGNLEPVHEGGAPGRARRGLPLGTWQAAPSNPFAPLFAPFGGGGGGAPPQPPGLIPPSGGRGGAQPMAGGAPLDLTPTAAPAAPAGRGRPAPAASDAPVPPANVPDAEPGRKTNAFLDKIFGNL